MMNTAKTVRYTTTLPQAFLDNMKDLAKCGRIASVNSGIRQAVDDFLRKQKAEQFNALMKEAAQDDAFLERTYTCADDFKYSDSEVQGEW